MHDTSREPYLMLQRCFDELPGQIYLAHDQWQAAIHTQDIAHQLDLMACQRDLLADSLVILTALQHLTLQGVEWSRPRLASLAPRHPSFCRPPTLTPLQMIGAARAGTVGGIGGSGGGGSGDSGGGGNGGSAQGCLKP